MNQKIINYNQKIHLFFEKMDETKTIIEQKDRNFFPSFANMMQIFHMSKSFLTFSISFLTHFIVSSSAHPLPS